MKQARTYEIKIRKLLKAMPKATAKAPQECDPVSILVEAILSANAPAAGAARAVGTLDKEYVDHNELRVSPERDIVGVIGGDYPQSLERARQLIAVLNNVYLAACKTSLGYLEGVAKRELKRLLSELNLDEYSCAYVMIFAFDMHAVPVDLDLVDSLKLDSLVHPDSTLGDVQKVLERAVPKNRGITAHKFLRSYVQKSSKVLTKKRLAEAKVRQEAEAKAEAERLAAEKQAAARKAAKEAKAKEAEAKKVAKTKAAKKKASKKKVAKKTVKKAAAKKVAKKAVKKTAKKKAKTKTSRKAAGK